MDRLDAMWRRQPTTVNRLDFAYRFADGSQEALRRTMVLKRRPPGWMHSEGHTDRTDYWVYFAGHAAPNRNIALYPKMGGVRCELRLGAEAAKAIRITTGDGEEVTITRPTDVLGVDPEKLLCHHVELMNRPDGLSAIATLDARFPV